MELQNVITTNIKKNNLTELDFTNLPQTRSFFAEHINLYEPSIFQDLTSTPISKANKDASEFDVVHPSIEKYFLAAGFGFKRGRSSDKKIDWNLYLPIEKD
jgi:hypothetical protein